MFLLDIHGILLWSNKQWLFRRLDRSYRRSRHISGDRNDERWRSSVSFRFGKMMMLWFHKKVIHRFSNSQFGEQVFWRHEKMVTHGLPEGPFTWIPLMSLFVEHQPRLPGGTGALDPLQIILGQLWFWRLICHELWFVSTALVDDSFKSEWKMTLASRSFSSNRNTARSIGGPSPGTCWTQGCCF